MHRVGARLIKSLVEQPQNSAVPATHVAVVVAHPDDETIGIGGQLPRLRGVRLIVVTDGAPAGMADGRRHGFARREDYVAARRMELMAALAEAGIATDAFSTFDIRDQEAALVLPDIARRLGDIVGTLNIRAIFTHPYEGGHPDHDAVAFAVHAACRRIARSGLEPPEVVEMAFYHAGSSGMVVQRFLPANGCREIEIRLDEAAAARKRRMIEAHATQHDVLAQFDAHVERFRAAPQYDFRSLPNGGRLYYECFDWGMTGAMWQKRARAALDELGL